MTTDPVVASILGKEAKLVDSLPGEEEAPESQGQDGLKEMSGVSKEVAEKREENGG